ncbi:MAG: 1,4-beta-xylanase, partial [Chitinophagales bacterium]
MKKSIFIFVVFLFHDAFAQTARPVWSTITAKTWYAKQGWLRGCDFIPSSAINQLEMWQKETFDTATISRELGYASSIG